MNYPHLCVVTRQASTVGAGGKKVEGATSTIYSGVCDFQENSRQHDVQGGIQASKGSATVFFPVSLTDKGFQAEDAITVTLSPTVTQAGTVNRVDRLEDSVLMLYG